MNKTDFTQDKPMKAIKLNVSAWQRQLDRNNPNDVEWYKEIDLKNNNVNKAMEYAKASQAMEGLKVSHEQEKLILDIMNGEISEEEFNQRARKLANE